MRNRLSRILLTAAGLMMFGALMAPLARFAFAQTRSNAVVSQYDITEGMFHLVQNGINIFDTRVPLSQLLTGNTGGSSTNTLINTGIAFNLAGNTAGTTWYRLHCDIWYTASNSGGGLTLGINGPGTATELTEQANIETAGTTFNLNPYQGTTWATKLGTATTTTTTIQYASLDANIQNSANNPGTLNVQYADANTTGTTTVLNGSQCTLQ